MFHDADEITVDNTKVLEDIPQLFQEFVEFPIMETAYILSYKISNSDYEIFTQCYEIGLVNYVITYFQENFDKTNTNVIKMMLHIAESLLTCPTADVTLQFEESGTIQTFIRIFFDQDLVSDPDIVSSLIKCFSYIQADFYNIKRDLSPINLTYQDLTDLFSRQPELHQSLFVYARIMMNIYKNGKLYEEIIQFMIESYNHLYPLDYIFPTFILHMKKNPSFPFYLLLYKKESNCFLKKQIIDFICPYGKNKALCTETHSLTDVRYNIFKLLVQCCKNNTETREYITEEIQIEDLFEVLNEELSNIKSSAYKVLHYLIMSRNSMDIFFSLGIYEIIKDTIIIDSFEVKIHAITSLQVLIQKSMLDEYARLFVNPEFVECIRDLIDENVSHKFLSKSCELLSIILHQAKIKGYTNVVAPLLDENFIQFLENLNEDHDIDPEVVRYVSELIVTISELERFSY